MRSNFLACLSSTLLLSRAAFAAPDSCSALVPARLQEAVQRQYPSYRLPAESDNLAEDVRLNREHGGSGCLGVAAGRYRGSKSNDYALLLYSRSSDDKALLVIASGGSGSRWRLELLRDWGGGRGVMYVASAKPGKYTRFGGLDAPPGEPGELAEFVSALPGIVSGRVESSGVAYFFTANKWVHVWVSD